MRREPNPFRSCLFVCEHIRDDGSPSCGEAAAGLRDALKTAAKATGVANVRVNRAGCLGHCDEGPNVFAYPSGQWYSDVTLDDVPAIIAREIP